MVIATMDGLVAGVGYDNIMSEFCAWKTEAVYTAADEVFDMGVSTSRGCCSVSSVTENIIENKEEAAPFFPTVLPLVMFLEMMVFHQFLFIFLMCI